MQPHNFTPNNLQKEQGKVNHSFANAVNKLAADTAVILQELQKEAIPLDVLPAKFQELIKQLAEKYKFPEPFSLMYLLYAFSISIGNNYRVRVKKNWVEPAILYMAIVAKAGQTKTPVQSFFMAVFKELDKQYFEEWRIAVKEWEAKKKAATKENPFEEERPKRKQLLLQDYTPEALIKVLSDNWHGIGLMLDELAMLLGNMNRYNSGNEVPMWLSFFNAQAYSLNRKTSDDLYVAHPFVSIIGGIQLGILAKAFAGDMQINGYADRYVYACPIDLRKEVAGDEEVDDNLIESYTDAIKFLLSIQPKISDKDSKKIPRLLDLTPGAKELFFEYRLDVANKVNELNDAGQERLAGMYSKFDYHAIRLSLILQIVTDACNDILPTQITEEAVQGGIRLANYFKVHTERVHDLICGDPLVAYDESKRTFYSQLPDGEFTFSDAVAIARQIRKVEVDTGKIKPDAVEKWAQRFLNTKDLFSQPKTGRYIKKGASKTL